MNFQLILDWSDEEVLKLDHLISLVADDHSLGKDIVIKNIRNLLLRDLKDTSDYLNWKRYLLFYDSILESRIDSGVTLSKDGEIFP